MNATNPQTTVSQAAKKPGFFGRLWQKLDAKMQAKASSGCCCSDEDKSDNKAGKKCC